MSRMFQFALCLALFSAGCAGQKTATTWDAEYYPPPESQGGWRKLKSPEDIRRLGGMAPAKLADLKQWLLKSDDRPFAAVVIRHGYIVLEVVRDHSSVTNTKNVASCANR